MAPVAGTLSVDLLPARHVERPGRGYAFPSRPLFCPTEGRGALTRPLGERADVGSEALALDRTPAQTDHMSVQGELPPHVSGVTRTVGYYPPGVPQGTPGSFFVRSCFQGTACLSG
jgi:hypothetical protein